MGTLGLPQHKYHFDTHPHDALGFRLSRALNKSHIRRTEDVVLLAFFHLFTMPDKTQRHDRYG
jgi:hypothetical protein